MKITGIKRKKQTLLEIYRRILNKVTRPHHYNFIIDNQIFILQNNHFSFDDLMHHLISRIAIGTKVFPIYTNLEMVFQENQIYEESYIWGHIATVTERKLEKMLR